MGMSNTMPGEEVGASLGGVVIITAQSESKVRINPGAARRIAEAPSGRVYLVLDGVRGTQDPTILEVQLLRRGDPPERAVSIGGAALYGLRRASAGEGLMPILDATPFFKGLNRKAADAVDEIIVSFWSNHPLPPDDPITIQRIALFYEDYGQVADHG